MITNRRDFLKQSLASTLLTGPPLASLLSSAVSAQQRSDALAIAAIKANQRVVVIAGATGAFGEFTKRTFYDPFTAATGIKVTPVPISQGERMAKLQAQYKSGAPKDFDVVVLPADRLPAARPFLRDLQNCSELGNVVADAAAGACLRHAVITNVGAGVLTYGLDEFPDGKPQPANWVDFWDLKKFPGPRALPNFGSPWWNLAAALIADGVPQHNIFPLDLNRAFKKLDQIKDSVVWWTSGDQSMQLMRSREVVMGMLFVGRAVTLRTQGVKTRIVWSGAPLDANTWAVTREAPHPLAALALINFFFSRPAAHVAFLKFTGESTMFKPMVPLLDANWRAVAAVAPDNWGKLLIPDQDYIAANQSQLLSRWNAWIAS